MRWLAISSVLFALVLAVAGCGGGDDEAASNTTTLTDTTIDDTTSDETTTVDTTSDETTTDETTGGDSGGLASGDRRGSHGRTRDRARPSGLLVRRADVTLCAPSTRCSA